MMKNYTSMRMILCSLVLFFAVCSSNNALAQITYCPSAATSTADTDIGNVTIGTFSNGPTTPILSSPNANGTYSDFTALGPINLTIGVPTTISITQITSGGTFYASYVKVYIDFNGNGDWTDVGETVFQSAITQTTNPVTGTITVPATAIPGFTRLRVKQVESGTAGDGPCGTFTWGEVEDYTVLILSQSSTDVGITQITSPNSGCALTSTTPITVRLRNFGTSPQSFIPIGYTLNNGFPVTDFFSGTLAPNADTLITFSTTADLSTPGTYTIKAFTALVADTIPINDTTQRTVTSIPVVSTFPYIQNFESGNGGWIPDGVGSSWALGTPSATVINTAGSGSSSWATNLSGNYNTNERSFVTSPCFNLSSLTNPQVELKAWWSSETADGAILQASIDGGNTWTKVGAFGDPDNWYNQASALGVSSFGGNNNAWSGLLANSSGGWVTARNALSGLAGQTTVRFRVAFGSDGFGVANGFAFDDFVIQDPPAADVGVSNITSPGSGCGLTGSTPVTVRIRNFGATSQSNFQVGYSVDNGTPVTEFFFGSVAPGTDTTQYTFTTTANLGAPGTYQIKAWTQLTGDANVLNDTAQRIVTGIPTIASFPYFQGFESGAGGWVSGGALNSWALGTPAGTIINSAGGGSNSWVTNLTGNYNDSERSFVVSPCFDFSGLTDPRIEMKVWWNSESGWDGAQLQSSIDGGATWQRVGVFQDPDGQNWYNSNNFTSTDVATFFNNQTGWWSGRVSSNNGSGGWVVVKNKLTGLAGQSAVRLRIAFGSDTSVPDEGFAFDDILIGDPPQNDAGVIALDPPAFCPGPVNLSVRIRNFGVLPITSVNATINVDGISIGTGTFSGTLAPQADTLLPVGLFVFAANTPYNIVAFTSNPNGQPDGNANNDTLFRLNAFSSLAGTVTVGGTGANFSTLSALATAVNSSGLCGALDVEVNDNITETSKVVFNNYAGSTFPMTIKPTGGSRVISGNVAEALIEFNGAKNITINGDLLGAKGNLTFTNTSTSTNTAVFRLRSNSSTTGTERISILNSNITGPGSASTSNFGIYAGGATISTFGTGNNHDFLRVEGNRFGNTYYGLYARAVLADAYDSLRIVDNIFGDSLNPVNFRGVDIQNTVNPLVSDNEFFLTLNNSSTIAAIEVGGTVPSNAIIERNNIRRVHQLGTGGAYGISLIGGNGHTIVNNLITGVGASPAFNTSQFTNPFGIRISSGTGHRIYYNSVNMYLPSSTTSTAGTASAAFVVSSTAVSGLDVRNNIFANTMVTGSTGTHTHVAMWFPTSYSFATNQFNHNAYFIPNGSTQHSVARIGTTTGGVVYQDLNAWRAISQVSNPTNDVNSQPVSNNIPPFINNDSLYVASGTATPAESGGVVIATLGTPNTDFAGVNRPAGSGTAPDIGAIEFDGITGDFIAPTVDTVFFDPDSNLCVAAIRQVTAIVTDLSGVDTVQILYTLDGVVQAPINMFLSGLNTYLGSIPASGSAKVRFRIRAVDSSPAANFGFSSFLEYQDESIGQGLLASTTTPTINSGDSAFVSVFSPLLGQLKITEIVMFRGGTGTTTPFPAYIPAVASDFLEITNLSLGTADLSGFVVDIYGVGARTYTFPSSGVTVPGNSVLVLHIGPGTDDPANRYYNTGGFNDNISSGSSTGVVLRTGGGTILDAVAFNTFTFDAASGVTSADWNGTGAPSPSGASGSQLLGPDLNNSSNWTSTGTTTGTLGAVNSGLVVSNPLTVSWSYLGQPVGSSASIGYGPVFNLGPNVFTATVTDGSCSASASVTVNVISPTPPVAGFTASSLIVNTGQTVSFTDTSSNLPSSWSWVFTPSTVTFVGGTSATSQNPEVQFNNPGLYTVALTATNPSGSNTVTKTDYISVLISYCPIAVANAGDTDIGNVTLNNLNNGVGTPTLSNINATGQYTSFVGNPSVATVILVPDSTYTMSITQITSGAFFYDAYANVFIDYNGNGLFTDSGERVFSAGPTLQTSPILTGTITVPTNATIGYTRMRVILDEAGSATSGPCQNFSWGEVEDYLVEISNNPLGIVTTPELVEAMYPNPAFDKVFFRIDQFSERISLVVTDVTGKQVMPIVERFNVDGTIDLDVSSLQSGVYIVNLVSGDRSIQKKLIKQ